MKLKKFDLTLKIFLDRLFSVLESECNRIIEEYDFDMEYDKSYDCENELRCIDFIYHENFFNLDDMVLDLKNLKMCFSILCTKYDLEDLYPIFSVGQSVIETNDIYSDLDIEIVKEFISGFYSYIYSKFTKIPLCIKLVKEEYEKII